MKSKRGSTLLTENIIFIILNLIFITLLVIFLISRSGSAAVMEEKYAKEIALVIDSSSPGMMMTLDMKDAVNAARKSFGEGNLKEMVNIQNNIITVKLRNGKGYSYSFFNNVNISNYYLDKASNNYVFFIGNYNEKARGG